MSQSDNDKKLAKVAAYAQENMTTWQRLAYADGFLDGLAKRDEQYKELVGAAKYAEEFFVVSMPYFKDEIMKQDAKESLQKLRDALKPFTEETEK